VILVTNLSNARLEAFALSYAAGLPEGTGSVAAKELEIDRLPKRLVWTGRKPDISVDPLMMKRYGVGQVFELGPGEGIRLPLLIYVPQARPQEFVEHFALGYRPTAPGNAQVPYKTYVAKVKS
jgi:hypothetical protein